MKYKKILFIRASPATAWVGAISPPVGIAYLMEALKKYGCQCKIFDTALGYSMDKMYDAIRFFQPDVIGISMLTYRYKDTYKMTEKIKERFPGIPVIVGGAHVSTLRESVLESCNAFDYGFVREAEESLVEFCQGKDPSQIKGIIYRNGKGVVYTGDREPISDLDSISWPRDYGIDLDNYLSKEILILSSRGCPYSCIFCPVSLAIGKRLRIRSASNVIEEIEYWYNKGYRRFVINDDNFTFYKERVSEICDEIERRGLRNIVLRCGNGIRADKVNRELLEKMKKAGFTYLSYGVESGNDKVLRTLKKGETIEQIENAVRLSVELGFDVTLFFVVGAPGETVEDVEDSIRISMKYPVMDVRFYNLIPYPGTELFRWVQENNYFVTEPEEYLNDASGFSVRPVFQTPELSIQQRISLMKRLNRVTKDVRKNFLHNKLKALGTAGIPGYYLFSDIYASNTFQTLVRQNKLLRRMIDFAYTNIQIKGES